jgi:hypothetical protein
MSAVGRFGAIAAFALVLVSACVQVKSEGRELGLLPEGFEQSDLVATWQALYGGDPPTTDTIILREDGTYQQIYHRNTDNYRFETPWQRWYVETRPSGKLYVHLEGMHYCILTDEVCALEKGGGGGRLLWDPGEGRNIKTEEEVVLLVSGMEGLRHPRADTAPRGITLVHMKFATDTGTDFFFLQE